METKIIWLLIVALAVLGLFLTYAYKVGRESSHSSLHLLQFDDNNPLSDDDDEW